MVERDINIARVASLQKSTVDKAQLIHMCRLNRKRLAPLGHRILHCLRLNKMKIHDDDFNVATPLGKAGCGYLERITNNSFLSQCFQSPVFTIRSSFATFHATHTHPHSPVLCSRTVVFPVLGPVSDFDALILEWLLI